MIFIFDNILARRRRRKRTKSIILNKYKVGVSMVAIGGLYFFAFGLADGSPLLNFFQTYASIAFGEIGVHVFFGLTALV
jgi:hypothetical protein